MNKQHEKTFQIKYSVNSISGCWEWNKVNKQGYGRFYFSGTSIFAHRFSYLLYKGNIPENYVVRHLCNNPKCVNPNHLAIGTTADNMLDKVLSGRQAKGNEHGMSVLTEAQVKEIYQSSLSNYDLADQYNTTPQMISFIRSGKNWKHITKNLPNGRILNRGEFTKDSKLTEVQAIEILKSSEPHHILANRYGVHTNTIQNLRDGKTWKHLDRNCQLPAQKGCSSAKGDKHGMAKLSVEEVRIIKKLLPTTTNNKIADMFKVSPATISAIRVGRVWTSV